MTSTRFVLLFLSTLLMGVYSVCDNTTCINTEGLCVGDFCACGSGLSGTDCTNMTTNCAGGWANITQLATGNYPTLDLVYSGIYGGNLLIRLTSPLVNNRSSTYIYLRDPLVYPNCALGAWTKTYAGCNEQYDLSVDWAVAATTCGFDVNTTDPNFIAYTNGLFVEDEDIVAEFRGSPVLRASTHNFPVLIKTQTRIAINTTVNINAPVRLLAAITKQSYNITSTTGILEFSTSLQWPFQLNDVSLIGQPNGLTINVLSLNTSCGNTFGNVCDQLYRLTIDPGQVCTLSGTYILNYTIACRGNQTLCPLDTNTNKASITGLIVSEQFCTPVDINIGLTGAVLIYDSASFTNQKVAFLPTQTAFFRAYLSTGSTATILSSSVVGVSVQLVAGGAEKVLRIVGQGNTAYGDAVSLTDVTSAAYNPSFSLVVNNDIFPVPVDGQLPFIVTVTIDVSYTTGARKRFVVVKRQVITDSQKTLLNALVQVAGSTSSSSPAATSAATTAATTAATSAATSSPTSSSTSNSPTGNTGTTDNTGNTATGTATGTGTSNPSPSPSPSSPPTQGSASASALAITALLVLAL